MASFSKNPIGEYPGYSRTKAQDIPGNSQRPIRENPGYSGKFPKRNPGYLDFSAINEIALRDFPALLARWLPDGRVRNGEWVALNPTRNDRTPGSFSINIRTGKWADFATGDKGGDVISLAAYLSGSSQAEAARRLADYLGVPHA